MEQGANLEIETTPIKLTDAAKSPVLPTSKEKPELLALKPDKNRQKTNSGEWYSEESADGEKRYWLVTTPEDQRLINNRWVKFSEGQLKAEYIALKIYKELGLEVPDARLIKIKDKTALAFEDLGNIRSPRDSEETTKLRDNQAVKASFVAHLYLDTRYAETALAKRGNDVVWTDARGALGYWRNKTTSERDDDELHLGSAPDADVYLKESKMFSKVVPDDMTLMARKIAGLDNERIVSIVREAGLPIDQTRKIIRSLLRRKENITKSYARETPNIPEDTPEWLALEARLEESVGNKRLKEASTEAQIEAARLEKVLNNKGQIDQNLETLDHPSVTQKLATTPKQQVRFEEVVTTLGQELEKLGSAIDHFDDKQHDSGDILSYSAQLINIQQHLTSLQKANPWILATITGKASHLENIKRNIVGQVDNLRKVWAEYQGQIPFSVRQIIVNHTAGLAAGYFANKSRPRIESYDLEKYALGGPKDWNYYPWEERQLVRYYAVPSLKQIQQLESIRDTLKQMVQNYPAQIDLREQQKMLGLLIEHSHNRRNLFKVKCEEIQNATASHVTTKELAKKILTSGSIKSSLLQSLTEQTAYVNSPGGQRELLPAIAFAVNGAEDAYGGSADESQAISRRGEYYMQAKKIVDTLSARMNQEGGDEICFLAGNYPKIVDGKQFCELQNTQSGIAQELHVFDPNYSPDNVVGAGVKIDHLIFLCPEKDHKDWEAFLFKPVAKGGAGKEKSWIEAHLKTYPSDISVSEWLRYLDSRQQLGLPHEPPGFFAATGKLMTQHDEKTPLFSWVTS